MIKISSGILRSVLLRSPAGKQTRPSSERLRQGTFNVLRHHRVSIFEEGPVIDLFGGTGAWGIEAISNGATEVWFVESHPLALKTLQANLNTVTTNFEAQKLELPKIHVLRQDVAAVYNRLPESGLVFCDPPYERGWFERIFELERKYSRIRPGGLLLYEAAEKEPLPADFSPFELMTSKIYGDSTVHFFIKPAA